jgi:hypothetical protein
VPLPSIAGVRRPSGRLVPASLLACALLICPVVGCGAGSDPRSASWSYISTAITEPNCATVSCHSRATAIAGLDFSDPDRGFTSLTGLWVWIVDPLGDLTNGCMIANGVIVCQRERRSLVVPFDPAQSRVVHMLHAQGAPRMPPDRPLAAADIRLIENWILGGARRFVGVGQAADVVPRDGPGVDAGAGG